MYKYTQRLMTNPKAQLNITAVCISRNKLDVSSELCDWYTSAEYAILRLLQYW